MKFKSLFSFCLSLIIVLLASINVAAVSADIEENMSESIETQDTATGGWIADPYERLGSKNYNGVWIA